MMYNTQYETLLHWTRNQRSAAVCEKWIGLWSPTAALSAYHSSESIQSKHYCRSCFSTACSGRSSWTEYCPIQFEERPQEPSCISSCLLSTGSV